MTVAYAYVLALTALVGDGGRCLTFAHPSVPDMASTQVVQVWVVSSTSCDVLVTMHQHPHFI